MLQRSYPRLSTLEYIANGVDDISDDKLDELGRGARARLKKKQRDIIIGHVGQLIPRKNVSIAFEGVCKTFC
jgi:glycosyltransferase involved in cell wall biosynthesis